MLKAHIDNFRFGSHFERYQQVFGTAGSMLDAASLHVASRNGTSPSPIHRVGAADFKGIVLPAYYTDFPFSDRLTFAGLDGSMIGYEMTKREHGGATRVHVFDHQSADTKRFSGWSIVRWNILVESFDLGEPVSDSEALDWGLNLLEGMTTADFRLTDLEDADISMAPSPFVPARQQQSGFRLRQRMLGLLQEVARTSPFLGLG